MSDLQRETGSHETLMGGMGVPAGVRLDEPARARRSPLKRALLGAGVSVVLGGVGALVVLLSRKRAGTARRLWSRPERITVLFGDRFGRTLGRRVLMGALTFTGVALAKRMIRPLIGEARRSAARG